MAPASSASRPADIIIITSNPPREFVVPDLWFDDEDTQIVFLKAQQLSREQIKRYQDEVVEELRGMGGRA